MSGPFARLGSGWNRFWFEPQETSTLALFRIAFGLIASLWTVSLIPNLFAFFGPDGILPDNPQADPGEWGIFALSTGRPLLTVVFTATLAGSLALTVGLRTRLAAVVVFLGMLSFLRRNPWVWDSGDELMCNLALLCALAPSGEALSLDRLRTAPGRFWEFPARAPWALRLIQIQLSVMYLSTVWQKVQGDTWRNGTAVSYALRITDIQRFATPAFVTHSVVFTELLTFGTLALEAALGVLVWNRVARPWVLALGVSMHLGIDYSILVGFFSYAVIVSYLAFIPPETASRLIITLRDRLRRKAEPAASGGDSGRPTAQGGPDCRRLGDQQPEHPTTDPPRPSHTAAPDAALPVPSVGVLPTGHADTPQVASAAHGRIVGSAFLGAADAGKA